MGNFNMYTSTNCKYIFSNVSPNNQQDLSHLSILAAERQPSLHEKTADFLLMVVQYQENLTKN